MASDYTHNKLSYIFGIDVISYIFGILQATRYSLISLVLMF